MRLLTLTMYLIMITLLLWIIKIGLCSQTISYCQIVDTNERLSGKYTTKLCNFGFMQDASEALVSIGKNDDNMDGTRNGGITLTLTELYKIACIIKCNQIYNTTIIK
jgi:hypothetical protein